MASTGRSRAIPLKKRPIQDDEEEEVISIVDDSDDGSDDESEFSLSSSSAHDDAMVLKLPETEYTQDSAESKSPPFNTQPAASTLKKKKRQRNKSPATTTTTTAAAQKKRKVSMSPQDSLAKVSRKKDSPTEEGVFRLTKCAHKKSPPSDSSKASKTAAAKGKPKKKATTASKKKAKSSSEKKVSEEGFLTRLEQLEKEMATMSPLSRNRVQILASFDDSDDDDDIMEDPFAASKAKNKTKVLQSSGEKGGHEENPFASFKNDAIGVKEPSASKKIPRKRLFEESDPTTASSKKETSNENVAVNSAVSGPSPSSSAPVAKVTKVDQVESNKENAAPTGEKPKKKTKTGKSQHSPPDAATTKSQTAVPKGATNKKPTKVLEAEVANNDGIVQKAVPDGKTAELETSAREQKTKKSSAKASKEQTADPKADTKSEDKIPNKEPASKAKKTKKAKTKGAEKTPGKEAAMEKKEASSTVAKSDANKPATTKKGKSKVSASTKPAKEPTTKKDTIKVAAPAKPAKEPTSKTSKSKKASTKTETNLLSATDPKNSGTVTAASNVAPKAAAKPDAGSKKAKEKVKVAKATGAGTSQTTKPKKKRFDQQIMDHMVSAMKPFTLKTLSQGLNTTEQQLHHTLLSMKDKGLVVEKEFASKGRSKMLIWANLEAKEAQETEYSAERAAAADHELQQLVKQERDIQNELAAVFNSPSNEELQSKLAAEKALVANLEARLEEMKGRIDSAKAGSELTPKPDVPGFQCKPKSAAQLARERCPRRLKIRINAMRSEWKIRRDKCKDFVDTLSDAMEKKPKDVIKLLELETDEMVGVTLPAKYEVDTV